MDKRERQRLRDLQRGSRRHRRSCKNCAAEFIGFSLASYCSAPCMKQGQMEGRWARCFEQTGMWPACRLKTCRTCAVVIPRLRTYCSDCAAARNKASDKRRSGHAQVKPCPRCGIATDVHGSKCERCRIQYLKDARRRKKWLERNRRIGITSDNYTVQEIGARDGWICGLCRKRIDPRTTNLHKSPSIDHIIPISVGGNDTRANVQIAHFICNTRKGNRAANDQLLLVG